VGGHIWEDNVSTNRFPLLLIADAGTGAFVQHDASQTEGFVRSTIPKSQVEGKVGFLDPRTPVRSKSIWSFSGTSK